MNVSSTSNDTQKEIYRQILLYWHLLIVWIVLGACAVVLNVIFLLLSKFTTAGQSPVLVFVRSICLADCMTGTYGIFKALILYNLPDVQMNCFLPESLFITASTSAVTTLVWLHVDCFLRIKHPLSKYRLHMKKENVVTGMVILWNVSFVIGFVPHMGWNVYANHTACSYEQFFALPYIYVLTSLFCISLITSCILELLILVHINRVNYGQQLLTSNNRQIQQYHNLIVTNRIEIISWIICVLLLLGFLVVVITALQEVRDLYYIEIKILFVVPVFLSKSIITAMIRMYKSTQIHVATSRLKRQVTKIVSKHSSLEKNISNVSSLTVDTNVSHLCEENCGHVTKLDEPQDLEDEHARNSFKEVPINGDRIKRAVERNCVENLNSVLKEAVLKNAETNSKNSAKVKKKSKQGRKSRQVPSTECTKQYSNENRAFENSDEINSNQISKQTGESYGNGLIVVENYGWDEVTHL